MCHFFRKEQTTVETKLLLVPYNSQLQIELALDASPYEHIQMDKVLAIMYAL